MGLPRLLVVDGMGGTSPRDYLRSLTPLAELKVVHVPPPFPDLAAQKARELATRADTVEVVTVERPDQVVEAITTTARSWSPDGVFAQNEHLLSDVAVAAEQLGLPYHSAHAASLLRRKDLQRAALLAAGVPGPRVAVLEPGVDPAVALAEVGLPAVLKPTVGVGSISTMLVDSASALTAAVREAARNYRDDPRMYGREPVLMLESLLAGQRWHRDERYGDHASVESLVFDGEITHLAVSDKLPLAAPFRETGHVLPSILDTERQDVLRAAATEAIRALDLRHGATHIEFKLTEDGPRVIEVNGRLGGSVARQLELTAGYDVLADLGRMALGTRPQTPTRFKCFSLWFTPASPQRDVVVRAVHGEQQARTLAGVRDLAIRYRAGARPDWRMGGFSSLWRAMIISPTAEDLFTVAQRLENTLTVELDDAG
ncbi:ATP-grasp domain-containing protein [Actinophytocola sp.]|uniref:ATP-grasp domain-containing protein n=1 Tax=Actinophytocola sp. TaxID=1872138 RepID=UPI002ED04D1C